MRGIDSAALLLVFLGSLAVAQQASQPIQFTPAPQTVIEERLRGYVRKNSEREPALRRLFEDAGCDKDALLEQPVKGAKAPNLVCTHTGATDATIIVGAHFDLIETGDGVVDNWSGAALLPSTLQALAGAPRKHTFEFVAFTGEESGLIGSKSFVKQLGEQRSHVKAMVNMDSLGLSDTKVWVSHSDQELVRWLGALAKTMNLPITCVNVDQVGSTDSEPFREGKIPAITVHSVTQETLKILHSPADKIEAIHLDEYYRTYRLVSAYLAFLDQKLE